MKLDTRRTIRGWLLSLPDQTPIVMGATSLAFVFVGLLIEAEALFVIGVVSLLGGAALHGQVRRDGCPNCRSEVDVFSERYCSICGARLDDVEVAPPIDDRVDERFRPVGLREIERTANRDIEPSPPIDAIADGGEYNERDEQEGDR